MYESSKSILQEITTGFEISVIVEHNERGKMNLLFEQLFAVWQE